MYNNNIRISELEKSIKQEEEQRLINISKQSKRKADSVSVGFSLSAEYEVKCIWFECDHE